MKKYAVVTFHPMSPGEVINTTIEAQGFTAEGEMVIFHKSGESVAAFPMGLVMSIIREPEAQEGEGSND